MHSHRILPKPVFDTRAEVSALYKQCYAEANPLQSMRQWLQHCYGSDQTLLPEYALKDFQVALNFLYSYRGSQDTFSSYRRDVERLLQWSWLIKKQSILEHKREDIESFIEFCIAPLTGWIGIKTVARFKEVSGEKRINKEWRPFVVNVSKQAHKQGIKPQKSEYQFSQQALKVMFSVLSSFYNFMVQEQVTLTNPVMLIRQKSKFIRKDSSQSQIRRLSNQQWKTVIAFSKQQALGDAMEERTVFILSCLYGMYLRISELVSSERWTPTMSDFSQDNEGNWWFKVVGKGNKLRQIAVSDAMLAALKHYRESYLGLPPYPMPNETIPLFSHLKNVNKPLTSTRPIRRLVQACFDQAADKLETQGNHYEAEQLRVATVHWLRHTGISDDVKHRPREHVRDDAGHSSSSITDKYIDVELKERARTAKNKAITEGQ